MTVTCQADVIMLDEQLTSHIKHSRGADDADEVIALELPVHILVARVPQRVNPLEPRVIRQQLGDTRPALNQNTSLGRAGRCLAVGDCAAWSVTC